MRNLFIIIYLFIITSIISCSHYINSDEILDFDKSEVSTGVLNPASEEQNDYEYEKSAISANDSRTSNESKNFIPSDKIIKTAYVNIEIEDYKETLLKIKQIISSNKGYISKEDEKNYSYSLSNNIVIRVNNENFDILVDLLCGVAKKIDSKNISSQDVGEEFVDITARLKTKKEVEKRYIDLLKQARTIHEILEVEEELRVIREEIEAKEGRLKYLSNQVDYSTINLNIYQKFQSPIYQEGFFSKIADAFSGGWHGVKLLIIGLLYLWPLWIFLSVGLYILFRLIRKKKK